MELNSLIATTVSGAIEHSNRGGSSLLERQGGRVKI